MEESEDVCKKEEQTDLIEWISRGLAKNDKDIFSLQWWCHRSSQKPWESAAETAQQGWGQKDQEAASRQRAQGWKKDAPNADQPWNIH